MPQLAAHGNACPNNLLVRPGGKGFTLIVFSFFRMMPVGFDLGQLLIGDVQIGNRPVDDLETRGNLLVNSYVGGLAEEGLVVDAGLVERSYALQLALFGGLTSLPVELLDCEPTDQVRSLIHARARVAAYSMRLLEKTMS